MDGYLKIDINLFAIIILLPALYQTCTRKSRAFTQNKIFAIMLISTVVMLIIDTLTWLFDGTKEVILFHYLYYFFQPLPMMSWAMYALYQLKPGEYIEKRHKLFYAIPLGLNIFIVTLNYFVPFIYYFDSAHQYHRLWGFFFVFAIILVYIIGSYVAIARNHEELDAQKRRALILFPIPPLIGGSLQALFFGVILIFPGVAFSALIIYNSIQQRILSTDHLTGAYNRRELEIVIKHKMKRAAKGKTFAAIMLDIDNFKKINDIYGHDAGDQALISAANFMRQALPKRDFVFRYAGDEFILLLNLHDATALRIIVEKIQSLMEQYSRSGASEFELSASFGYAVYDPASGMDERAFISFIDALMYQAKRNK